MITQSLQLGFAQTPTMRRGAALIAVVVCLGVISTMLTAMAHAALRASSQVQRWDHHAQAYWLAEAAVEKAARQIRANQAYPGEVLKLSVAPHHSPAEVDVKAEPIGSANVRVTAVARYPSNSQTAVQCTKSIVVAIQ